MAHFVWSESLHTGSVMIDADHRQLVALLDALFDAMDADAAPERLAAAMRELVAYTGEHFRREEAEMERVQYVAALAHRSEHVKLLRQITELQAMLNSGGKINRPAVADFLNQWLRQHIVTADMKLAAALRAGAAPR